MYFFPRDVLVLTLAFYASSTQEPSAQGLNDVDAERVSDDALVAGIASDFPVTSRLDSKTLKRVPKTRLKRLEKLKSLLLATGPTLPTRRRFDLRAPARLARVPSVARRANIKMQELKPRVPPKAMLRSYAPMEFFNSETEADPIGSLTKLIEADCNKFKQQVFYKGADWTSVQYRVGLLLAMYFVYPFLAELLSFIPDLLPSVANKAGNNFFALLSIVFGTLTAATVSEASGRIASLRAIAVEEVTLLLSLSKRLEAALSETEEQKELLKKCLIQIWDHTSMFIKGSRTSELVSIASGDDPLSDLLVLVSKESSHLSWASESAERVFDFRARRLSLENAGIPKLQIEWLRATSIGMCLFYALFSLDRETFDAYNFDPSFWTDPATYLTQSCGVRAFFAYLVGLFTFSIDLADDLNQPFTGYFRLESMTITASLVQMRTSMGKILGLKIDEGLGSRSIERHDSSTTTP